MAYVKYFAAASAATTPLFQILSHLDEVLMVENVGSVASCFRIGWMPFLPHNQQLSKH